MEQCQFSSAYLDAELLKSLHITESDEWLDFILND